jgi:predicted kinase
MPRLIMLSGPSGSGKSTYRENLLKTFPAAQIISFDDILEDLAGQHNMDYQDAFTTFSDDVHEALELRLQTLTEQGEDLIWDQTNLSYKKRLRALEMIPDTYEFIAVAFEAPEDLLFERVAKREQITRKHIPEDVLKGQIASYERPHFDEGFDSIFVVRAPENTIERIS